MLLQCELGFMLLTYPTLLQVGMKGEQLVCLQWILHGGEYQDQL
jgi:hypothetical protein